MIIELPIFGLTIVSLLFGLINPYGIKAILYLFNSYGIYEINHFVAEMMSLSFENLSTKIICAIVFVVFLSFYYNKGNNKIRFFLLFIGTLYLGLSHFKGVIYFLIILPFLLFAFKKTSALGSI